MQLAYLLKSFQELSTDELYELLKLRSEVFVVEQNCVYQDIDTYDRDAFHLLGYFGSRLVSYVRMRKTESKVEIGRVVVAQDFRRKGLGKEAMRVILDISKEIYPMDSIKIAAQGYLRDFYSKMGFEQISDMYDWDGIDHLDMIKNR